MLTIDVLSDVFQELENIGGKNKVIFFQWKIEHKVMDKLFKILTDDDKTRLCEELENVDDKDEVANIKQNENRKIMSK